MDIVEFFKRTGPGYQTKINAVLRAYVQRSTDRVGEISAVDRRSQALSREPKRRQASGPCWVMALTLDVNLAFSSSFTSPLALPKSMRPA